MELEGGMALFWKDLSSLSAELAMDDLNDVVCTSEDSRKNGSVVTSVHASSTFQERLEFLDELRRIRAMNNIFL